MLYVHVDVDYDHFESQHLSTLALLARWRVKNHMMEHKAFGRTLYATNTTAILTTKRKLVLKSAKKECAQNDMEYPTSGFHSRVAREVLRENSVDTFIGVPSMDTILSRRSQR